MKLYQKLKERETVLTEEGNGVAGAGGDDDDVAGRGRDLAVVAGELRCHGSKFKGEIFFSSFV